ncbi:hypothetical protein BKA62DRAFT_770198 [Auriculariales sp. MPI-PUGE-AT-0066]|nr:hypothetical protein BKA62DRAFT_770198 [Auriculariales sp. MPI-PUGE-AT-0066]
MVSSLDSLFISIDTTSTVTLVDTIDAPVAFPTAANADMAKDAESTRLPLIRRIGAKPCRVLGIVPGYYQKKATTTVARSPLSPRSPNQVFLFGFRAKAAFKRKPLSPEQVAAKKRAKSMLWNEEDHFIVAAAQLYQLGACKTMSAAATALVVKGYNAPHFEHTSNGGIIVPGSTEWLREHEPRELDRLILLREAEKAYAA